MAVLGIGVSIACVSMVIARNGTAFWVVPLPAVGAYALLVLGVYFRNQDNPLGRLLETLLSSVGRRPAAAMGLACLSTAIALGLATYLWTTRPRSDGELRFLVFDAANIAGRRGRGLKMELEHIVGADALATSQTNEKGVAVFPVNIGEAITVRLLTDKGAYVVEPNKTIKSEDLAEVKSVDLRAIPDSQWLSTQQTADLGEQIGFLKLDPALLRWRPGLASRTIGDQQAITRLAPDGTPEAEILIARQPFIIGFSPNLRQPRWIVSEISIEPQPPRTVPRYAKDPAIPEEIQADPQDYARNIYDRADLVRRSDLGLEFAGAPERTFMTMITPQTNLTNQKLWLGLEEHTSALKTASNRVFVLRGPAFDGAVGQQVAFNVLRGSRVPVPTHYFQVVKVVDGPRISFECHLVPNVTVAPVGRGQSAERYRTTLATIESMTGLHIPTGALARSQVCA